MKIASQPGNDPFVEGAANTSSLYATEAEDRQDRVSASYGTGKCMQLRGFIFAGRIYSPIALYPLPAKLRPLDKNKKRDFDKSRGYEKGR